MRRGGFSPKLGFPPREGSRLRCTQYFNPSLIQGLPCTFMPFIVLVIAVIAIAELIVKSIPEIIQFIRPKSFISSQGRYKVKKELLKTQVARQGRKRSTG